MHGRKSVTLYGPALTSQRREYAATTDNRHALDSIITEEMWEAITPVQEHQPKRDNYGAALKLC